MICEVSSIDVLRQMFSAHSYLPRVFYLAVQVDANVAFEII